jgi:hypothetical protein
VDTKAEKHEGAQGATCTSLFLELRVLGKNDGLAEYMHAVVRSGMGALLSSVKATKRVAEDMIWQSWSCEVGRTMGGL